jgi:hypothetical protein
MSKPRHTMPASCECWIYRFSEYVEYEAATRHGKVASFLDKVRRRLDRAKGTHTVITYADQPLILGAI